MESAAKLEWLANPAVLSTVEEALGSSDDGELYAQYALQERLQFSDGRLKVCSYSESEGFGLRSVVGEAVGFARANGYSGGALERAACAVRAAHRGNSGTWNLTPKATRKRQYSDENPVSRETPADRVNLLSEIDRYVRAKDQRVVQVTISLFSAWDHVGILRLDSDRILDSRPMVGLSITVLMTRKQRTESGTSGAGGRYSMERLVAQDAWRTVADEAIDRAAINLRSVPAPAGEMTIVLGKGWPGMMLHEAVGHGLEGDAARKGESAYSGQLGQKVAADCVTVIDDAGIEDQRGSLSVDDEGTPGSRTLLIENGILRRYMCDRLNGRLLNMPSSGNGRRDSYASAPMPRMTNTFMVAGQYEPEEIIQSVDRGLYAPYFGGGQVDITSGNFVFSCTEAYLIKNGKVEQPVVGATLIGNGPKAMNQISMVGKDFALDNGIAICGKKGQNVPVCVGQPTVRIDRVTVGGNPK